MSDCPEELLFRKQPVVNAWQQGVTQLEYIKNTVCHTQLSRLILKGSAVGSITSFPLSNTKSSTFRQAHLQCVEIDRTQQLVMVTLVGTTDHKVCIAVDTVHILQNSACLSCVMKPNEVSGPGRAKSFTINPVTLSFHEPPLDLVALPREKLTRR